jgi:AcrR family transcriptional regulator
MTSTSQPTKRRYDASRRQAHALEGRRRILAAAEALFVDRGFAATTIAAIAEAADVSVPTVYAGFASKAELLRRAIEVALAGDDEPVAVADRPTASWVHEAETAEQLLGRYAVMMGELASRAGQIYGVLVAAADAEPELADLLRTFEAQRLRAATLVAEAVDTRGGLPPGRTVAEARDIIWLCNAPEVYVMLTGKRRWSTRRYVAWARNALVKMVLAPSDA